MNLYSLHLTKKMFSKFVDQSSVVQHERPSVVGRRWYETGIKNVHWGVSEVVKTVLNILSAK